MRKRILYCCIVIILNFLGWPSLSQEAETIFPEILKKALRAQNQIAAEADFEATPDRECPALTGYMSLKSDGFRLIFPHNQMGGGQYVYRNASQKAHEYIVNLGGGECRYALAVSILIEINSQTVNAPLRAPPALPPEIQSALDGSRKRASHNGVVANGIKAVGGTIRIDRHKLDPTGLGRSGLGGAFVAEKRDRELMGLIYLNDVGLRLHLMNANADEDFREDRGGADYAVRVLNSPAFQMQFRISKQIKVDKSWINVQNRNLK